MVRFRSIVFVIWRPPRRPVKAEETQQVFIGIFPASHIFVRDELADAEGRLPDLARSMQNGGAGSMLTRSSPGDALGNWSRDKASVGMDTLHEQDEDASRKSFKLGPPPDQANSSRARAAGLLDQPAVFLPRWLKRAQAPSPATVSKIRRRHGVRHSAAYHR